FILSDWRRENTPALVRGAGNQRIGALALQDAREGTLCVRCQRLSRDFKAQVTQLRGTEEVRLTVVGDGRYDTHPRPPGADQDPVPQDLHEGTAAHHRRVRADAVAELRVRQMSPREARFTEVNRA